MQAHEKIILPLDVSNIGRSILLVRALNPHVGVFKIGFEAIYSAMADLLLLSNEEAKDLLGEARHLENEITPEKAFLDVKLTGRCPRQRGLETKR